MFKKLWLVLAASAVFALGNVSAEEVVVEQMTAQNTEEAVAEIINQMTDAELNEVVENLRLSGELSELESAMIANDLGSLSAIENLKTKRNERRQLIKKIVLIGLSLGVLVIGGKLVYDKFFVEQKPAPAPVPAGAAAAVPVEVPVVVPAQQDAV